MKKKPNKKQIVYIDELDIVIECSGDNWEAHYYSDLSGELFVGSEDEALSFFRDDGGLKYQIGYLEEYMANTEKAYKTNMKACKEALNTLKKELAAFKKKKFVIKEEK